MNKLCKTVWIFFVALSCISNCSYATKKRFDSFEYGQKTVVRPESCNPTPIIHEDFESGAALPYCCSTCNCTTYDTYSEYPTGSGGGTVQVGSINNPPQPSTSADATTCNTQDFGGHGLYIDSQTNPIVAWGKNLPQSLPSGTYTLTFWTRGNSGFGTDLNHININVNLKSKNNRNSQQIDGSLVNGMLLANIDNQNVCGTLVRYSFRVYSNSNNYDQVNIVIYGNNPNNDLNIDEITFKQEVPLVEPLSGFTIPSGLHISNNPISFTATDAGNSQNTAIPASNYVWDWGDGTPTDTGISPTHSFAQNPGIPYNICLTVTRQYPSTVVYGGIACATTNCQPLPMYRPLCESTVPAISPANQGRYKTNLRTGSIDFFPEGAAADCRPIVSLECLGKQADNLSKIVSISMTAFADSLVQNDAEYRQGSVDGDPFLQGQGQLRPYASYTFQAPLSQQETLNYNAGTFSVNIFSPFASARARPAAWLATAVTERVSPNGDVLQERDPLGVRSVAKYGYGHLPGASPSSTHVLPYLQGHNTEANTVLFESFESTYDSPRRGEDQFVLLDAEVEAPSTSTPAPPAHTGTKSIQLKSLTGSTGAYQLTLKSVPLNSQLIREGLLVKCWLYLPEVSLANTVIGIGNLEIRGVGGTAALRTVPMNLVAQTGKWCLAEAQIPLSLTASGKSTLTAGMALVPRLQLQVPSTVTKPLRVDDVRMQPGKAQVTAYVYDPRTFRLLATFDDQHYALLYQYNNQGQLIRKQAETVRGVKTLQETFYHTPLKPIPAP